MSALEAFNAPRGLRSVSDDQLTSLMRWVVFEATAEQVAWNATEFSEIRDWLKANKAAADLRVKAVRLELIALRKVALAGLARKVGRNQKLVADWLGDMDDLAFQALLDEIKATDSPYGLRMKSGRDAHAVSHRIFERRVADGEADHGYETYYSFGLNEAVKEILDDLSIEGEPFSIVGAANTLRGNLLEKYEIDLPEEVAGEPLREVVRAVIRLGAMASTPYENEAGERVRVPEFVTYQEQAASGYVRLAWTRAGIEQLRSMTALRANQARQMVERYEQQQRLLDILDAVHSEHPEVINCDDLFVIARREHRIEEAS